jgi:hypothetical protein
VVKEGKPRRVVKGAGSGGGQGGQARAGAVKGGQAAAVVKGSGGKLLAIKTQ